MGLEYFLNHHNVELSDSKKMMRLRTPVHLDNESFLGPHLEKNSEGNYVTQFYPVEKIKKIIALEGPIFRAAPQLVHMSLIIGGLKKGYLFADPITFAEEFTLKDTTADIRKKIYNNWTNAINNSDITLAMTEYGQGYDPGVITGSIIQLNRGKPVIGLSLSSEPCRDDIFHNTIKDNMLYIDQKEIASLIGGAGEEVIDKIIDKIEYPKQSGHSTKSFGEIKGQYKKEYDVLITHEKNIEGVVSAQNIKRKLKENGRTPICLGEIDGSNHIHDLYDLAKCITKSNHVVILGDDSSEPGVIGSSTIQLANILETPFDMLRGDFRILTGEGEGAGLNQPEKGLYGASNLMIENLLHRGIYTKIDSLVGDLKK